MFKVQLTARAKRELKNISKRHKESLAIVLDDIKENPFEGKPLTRQLTGRYSLRIGIFRIIYKINTKDNIILVITAGHRSTIYQ